MSVPTWREVRRLLGIGTISRNPTSDGEAIYAGREPADDTYDPARAARSMAEMVLSDEPGERAEARVWYIEACRGLSHVAACEARGESPGDTPVPGNEMYQYVYGGAIGSLRVIQAAYSLAMGVMTDEEGGAEDAVRIWQQTDWQRVYETGEF